MDKQLIERIALEVVTTLPALDTAEAEWCEFATRFLARIDAERGKSAVAWIGQWSVDNLLLGCRVGGVSMSPQRDEEDGLVVPLFLSPAPVPEEFREIYVGGGLFAMCDSDDFEKVKGAWWHLVGKDRKTQYAQARFDGSRKLVSMHRLILDAPEGAVVDHINGNGLDNRRKNLRLCTVQQNTMNMTPRGTGSSTFKGVSLAPSGKWRAYIRVDGKRRHVGYFNNEVDAAKAYNEAASEFFGEFARTNNLIAAAQGEK